MEHSGQSLVRDAGAPQSTEMRLLDLFFKEPARGAGTQSLWAYSSVG
jgi:hypothetical protein